SLSLEHEVVQQRTVVGEKVLLDDLALVAETQNELVVTPHRVVTHDVPEDRPPADVDHRLRDPQGFLAHAHAEPTAEDHDLHPKRVKGGPEGPSTGDLAGLPARLQSELGRSASRPTPSYRRAALRSLSQDSTEGSRSHQALCRRCAPAARSVFASPV